MSRNRPQTHSLEQNAYTVNLEDRERMGQEIGGSGAEG
jgi:hypothetical protein